MTASLYRRVFTFLRSCCALFTIPTALLTLIFSVHVDYAEAVFEFSYSEGIFVLAAMSIIFALAGSSSLARLTQRIGYRRTRTILFVYVLLISVLWVFIADVQPDWDSFSLVDAALHFKDQTSCVWWQSGGYIERYPFQLFLIVILYGCHLLSGSGIIIFFEMLNCLAAAITVIVSMRIIELMTNSEEIRSLGILICALFLPLMLYCTFVYGNTICLPFCLGAMALQIAGFKTHRLWKHLMAIPLAILGILIKSSMLLVLVAMAVVWVVHALRTRKARFAAIAIASVMLYEAANLGFLALMQPFVITDLSRALPNSTWIVMGLHANENDKNTYMAGMNNNYVWAILDDEYEPDAYSEMNAGYLSNRLRVYVEDPLYAGRFLLKKYVYEWCEPTFGSIGASNWTRGLTDNVMADRALTPLAHSVYYGKLHTVIVFVCDVIQSTIMVGAALYVVACRKHLHIETMAPLLYAAGGALFYVFWEAKSQYILPLYLVLIPYTAIGITITTRRLFEHRENNRSDVPAAPGNIQPNGSEPANSPRDVEEKTPLQTMFPPTSPHHRSRGGQGA